MTSLIRNACVVIAGGLLGLAGCQSHQMASSHPMQTHSYAASAPSTMRSTVAAHPGNAQMARNDSRASARVSHESTMDAWSGSMEAWWHRYMKPEIRHLVKANPQADTMPDEAARLRHFSASYARYVSGAVKARPNYKLDRSILPHPLNREIFAPVTDPLLLVVQTVITPVWVFTDPAFRPVIYEGVEYPPTQTGAAPIPQKPVLRN